MSAHFLKLPNDLNATVYARTRVWSLSHIHTHSYTLTPPTFASQAVMHTEAGEVVGYLEEDLSITW
jgi:hypothetical protein